MSPARRFHCSRVITNRELDVAESPPLLSATTHRLCLATPATIAGAGERRDGDRERSPLKKSGSSTGSLNDNGSDDEIDEDSESQQMIV